MAYQRPHSPKSIKAAQLADLIRDLLASYIQRELQGGFVTVTAVTVSPDFQNATAWIRVFPSEESGKQLKYLQSHIGKFQGALRGDIRRKIVPRLHLELDTTLEDEAHIDSLLNQ